MKRLLGAAMIAALPFVSSSGGCFRDGDIPPPVIRQQSQHRYLVALVEHSLLMHGLDSDAMIYFSSEEYDRNVLILADSYLPEDTALNKRIIRMFSDHVDIVALENIPYPLMTQGLSVQLVNNNHASNLEDMVKFNKYIPHVQANGDVVIGVEDAGLLEQEIPITAYLRNLAYQEAPYAALMDSAGFDNPKNSLNLEIMELRNPMDTRSLFPLFHTGIASEDPRLKTEKYLERVDEHFEYVLGEKRAWFVARNIQRVLDERELDLIAVQYFEQYIPQLTTALDEHDISYIIVAPKKD